MSDNEELEFETTDTVAPQGVGAQLRAAREAKGLTIDQVAAETRISNRHIASIEAGHFNDLPGRTYAVGFSRTVAKIVGLNQADVAAMVRAELDMERPGERSAPAAPGGTFEPGDPTRAPGGKLVWFSLFAVVILLVGIFFAARVLFSPAAQLPSLVAQEEAEQQELAAAANAAEQEAAQPVDASGQVVFTAEGEAWVRFYDAQNRVLTERTLAEGESYTIPADAVDPKIITGRPDLLAITIGGRSVPKLSEELQTIQDVNVSAPALLARAGSAPDTDAPAGN
ncbi:helix-turn-helix domain-containing protein [Aurantiacibacter marinus]|uniref:HTH cro/C1-type domain-containing protein n=1 Tax=Aurantiacibacter marinus TaxID=874156 RepID=A0A0H0XQY2_9SPHN|nr:helix-turn-helix domain-containing protein [Aurantiacibacter marinus]KLI64322.1 hypothetical protein AAV99_01415 [Aurantiacibacter marinus]